MENPTSKIILNAACIAVSIAVTCPPPAKAQHPPESGTQPATTAAPMSHLTPAPAVAAKPALTDLAWLEGRWRGDWGSRVAEQSWFAPKAGVMTGLFRLVEGDKTLVLELFTLVEKPEGIDFFFRHFTPELVPWEKSGATVLNLASLDAKKVDFENAVNGQPKRAVLIRVDPDTYTARSEIIPETGDPQVIEITYHRQKPTPEKPSAGSGAHR